MLTLCVFISNGIDKDTQSNQETNSDNKDPPQLIITEEIL